MKSRHLSRCGQVLAAALALAAGICLGAPITVSNPSFETLAPGGLPYACGTGCSYSGGVVPGWTATGDTGQFRPGTDAGNFTYFNTLPDGPTVGYSNGSSLSQVVGALVQVGVVYTLQVDVGYRNDAGFTAVPELVINNATYLATGSVPVRGGWSTYTATYTGQASDAGKPIEIVLATTGPQGNFDNVRLNNNVVPEPATAAMAGIGLFLVAGFARRFSR